MKKCPFCPCEFEANSDFTLHMQAFSYDQEQHLQKYCRIHGLPDPRYTAPQQTAKAQQNQLK